MYRLRNRMPSSERLEALPSEAEQGNQVSAAFHSDLKAYSIVFQKYGLQVALFHRALLC